MAEHAVTFARSARRELESLPSPLGRRILARIESLAFDPRPRGCRKIETAVNLWRIRIGEDRRVFSVADANRHVDIVAIRHRRDAYR